VPRAKIFTAVLLISSVSALGSTTNRIFEEQSSMVTNAVRSSDLRGRAALIRALFFNLPLPGRYLMPALNLSRIDLNEIPSPIICDDRWKRFRIEVSQPRELLQKHILFQGYFEYYESRLLRRLLQPGQVFVDVGANIGWHSMLAADRVGPSGRVIACEPVSSTYSHLLRNIDINEFSQIDPHQIGLADRDAELNIYELESDNCGAHSLFSNRKHQPLERVRVRHAASFFDEQNIREVHVCKIDVEGAEVEVLKGLTSVLRERRIKILLLEINPEGLHRAKRSPDELIDLVRSNGFILEGIRTGREIKHSKHTEGQLNFIGRLPLL
jgi:FkbM family methyltransferase